MFSKVAVSMLSYFCADCFICVFLRQLYYRLVDCGFIMYLTIKYSTKYCDPSKTTIELLLNDEYQ